MARNIKLNETYSFITLINDKYFIDVRIDVRFDGENGLTNGAAFLTHIDYSNEYGENVAQQLTFRASQLDKEEKRIVEKMIEEYYDSLNHSKIILNHLKKNIMFFENEMKKECNN